MSSTDKFLGRVIHVTVDQVRLPNGVEAELEIIHHPGGAAVVALDEVDRVCLLRQYRHAAGGWLWELPAGKIDDGEPPTRTARRELAEEAGISAARWVDLGVMISSPGVFTERVYLYLARGLELGAHEREAEEVLEIHWVPFHEAHEMAMDGRIEDAKTVIGLLRARRYLGQELGASR
ncbi:MAG: NUDIX hydrolase [Pseudomonadota bacterium]